MHTRTPKTPLPPLAALLLAGIALALLPLAGCAAVPIGIGLIPGAPAYLSTVIGNGQSAYETAVDERDSRQQMLDAIIAGHAQAELLRHKDIKADQITAHCYFGKLYLVGEYDSQAQLETIHQCMAKVEGKRAVITRLYLREDTNGKAGQSGSDMWADASISASIRTQLLADFEVTSSPVAVEVVQGDIILLGVISCEEERARIMAHALNVDGVNRVVSYLYHQEIAGPTPRVMTAATAPKVLERAPSRRSSGKKTAARPVRKKAEPPMVVVANPDRGR